MSLTFTNIVCGYGDTLVVRGVSGQVQAGRALAIVGRNGVGKSTLLKGLAGLLPLAQGHLIWGGRDITGSALHTRVAQGMAYTPQDNVVFAELSVAENLWLHLDDRDADRYTELFEHFPLLARRQTQRSGSLSGGERKLLAFTRTLGLRPKLALLDEPTEGVQPENIDRMAHLIRQRKNTGASFIIVEQNLEFVSAFADDVIVLDHGEQVLQGAFADLGRERIERHMVV